VTPCQVGIIWILLPQIIGEIQELPEILPAIQKTRLQICFPDIFRNKATDDTYGSKYWFPEFGFDSGPNLEPEKIVL